MSRGPKVYKFTCLAPDVEVRGVVRSHTKGHHIDIVPDSNYRHMIWPPPARPTLLLEAYGNKGLHPEKRIQQGGCQDNPDGAVDEPTPMVRDGDQSRLLEDGMHIRVVGSWVTDNDAHAEDGAPVRRVGPFLVSMVKTELHPYFKDTLEIVHPLAPGGSNEQTLVLVAPVFRAAYYIHTSNKIAGNVGPWNNTEWRYSVAETIDNNVSVTWNIEAPPPPIVSLPHQYELASEYELLEMPTDSSRYNVIGFSDPSGLQINVSLSGDDAAHPARLRVRCKVFWRKLYTPPWNPPVDPEH